MGKFLLFPLLALLAALAAPSPVAAQSRSQSFCFVNDTLARLFRVKIREVRNGVPTSPDWTNVPGGSRHCVMSQRPGYVWYEVEYRNLGWRAAAPCNVAISNPTNGATVRAARESFDGLQCTLQ